MDEASFRAWLDERETLINAWLATLDPALRALADRSPASLRPVGRDLVARYASLAELFDEANRAAYGGVASYVFEVFRQSLDAEVALPLGDPRYQHHGVPVLRIGDAADIAPFDAVIYAVHRREEERLAQHHANAWEDCALVRARVARARGVPLADAARAIVASRERWSDDAFTSWLAFLSDRLQQTSSKAGKRASRSRSRMRPMPEGSSEWLDRIGAWLETPTTAAAAGASFDHIVSSVGELVRTSLGAVYTQHEDGQPALHTEDRVIPLWTLVLEAAASERPAERLAQVFAET